eukprot:c17621_g1_i2.p1 GENE.c17621_g1_i2~~c17621_g1_i2.p1  ORF type:complete len:218 (+),score=71.77 c17621_g1_i2:25-678(+)
MENKPEKIKLTYFNIEANAEKIRLAFVVGRIPFEDCRVNQEQWKELKPNTKFGQMPIADIDGEQFAQSGALLRYAGSLAGLYPEERKLALRVDEIISLTEDLTNSFVPQSNFVRNSSLSDEEKKKQNNFVFTNLKEKELPKFLGLFEGLLTKNATNFYVGDKVTLADIAVFAHLRNIVREQFPGVDKTMLDSFPLVKAHYERMSEIPEIKTWYSTSH